MRRSFAPIALAALALVLAGSSTARTMTAVRTASRTRSSGTPYGGSQLADFPRLVSALNRDPDVELTVHVGDIKDGASPCSDAYFDQMRANFDTLQDPLVLTPGDEWTDCHRPAAGRDTARPSVSRSSVRSSTRAPTRALAKRESVENPGPHARLRDVRRTRLWKAKKVVFATVHVVGSNNDLVHGSDRPRHQRSGRSVLQSTTPVSPTLMARPHLRLRRRGGGAWRRRGDAADMWFNTPSASPRSSSGSPTSARRWQARPTLEGDSHPLHRRPPARRASALHGVSTAAPNLTRIIVEGQTTSEWLKLRIDPNAVELFSWSRMSIP